MINKNPINDMLHRNIIGKKGTYIFGSPRGGKSHFVINLLEEMNCDIIKYDAGDVRNKSLINSISLIKLLIY